mgnify:CR=1 FL=1
MNITKPMDFPTIMHYALCITHYEFIQTRTTVRLYERVYYQMRGFPNNYALCIMNYALLRVYQNGIITF